MVPLYDPDTHMCFLSGKGDRNLQFIELTDKEPFFVEGLKYSGEQTKGACLVPKRAMDVMNAEVNRVLQLCGSSIVPITWQVPRKVSCLYSDPNINSPYQKPTLFFRRTENIMLISTLKLMDLSLPVVPKRKSNANFT